MTQQWSGRAVLRARAALAQRTDWPAPCARCGKPVQRTDRWVLGHKIARVLRPDLMWDPNNHQVEHRACSDRTGQQAVIDKARSDALREAGVFSHQTVPGQSPPLPFSLPVEPLAALEWDPRALEPHAWLRGLLPVPEDASPPLYMTPVPADAVGSHGEQACQWIEDTQRITLRWWQRLAIIRQLEHREDGSLCHREIVESAPRRAGKSVRVRGLVLWRMEHADLFGEPQTIVHTGSDVAICREIQRGAWRWAEGIGWTVTRANGKEAVETPSGDRWLVRAQDGVYGYDVCFGLVDEGWKVKPDTVSEGLEPATMERLSPQLHLTSTAHRRATSLMKSRLVAALTVESPGTLLMLWGAPSDADVSDPSTWRAASPHWSEDRHRMIARKYEKAVAGEVDPQADDLDPMEGFKAQYLNVWRLSTARTLERGEPVVSADQWAVLTALPPLTAPDSAAVESWYSEGVSLALAWRVGDKVLVTVSDHKTLEEAREALREIAYNGPLTVGASLASDPAFKGLRVNRGEGRTVAALQRLEALIRDEALLHDGESHLTHQVLGLRTTTGSDGPRISSRGRADAVKAAVWAVDALRSRVGKPRILVPSI